MAPTDDGAQTIPVTGSALIELATPDNTTEYRLGYNNFFVLTRYNRSSFYAAAVADLALAVKQGMTAQSRASLSTP
jgi:membrane-bound lytic murein transglycosylase B